jgi:hypothetical protein
MTTGGTGVSAGTWITIAIVVAVMAVALHFILGMGQ